MGFSPLQTDHDALGNVSSGDHHPKTTSGDIDHDQVQNVSASDHHAEFTDPGNDPAQVQHGVASLSGPDASANDDGMDSASSNLSTESFSTPFSATPTVVVGPDGDATDSGGWVASEQNNSTTAFDFEAIVYSGLDLSADTLAADYIAVGAA